MTAEERAERLSDSIAAALRAHARAALEEAAKMAEDMMPFIAEFDPRDCCTCNKEIAAAIRAMKREG